MRHYEVEELIFTYFKCVHSVKVGHVEAWNTPNKQKQQTRYGIYETCSEALAPACKEVCFQTE